MQVIGDNTEEWLRHNSLADQRQIRIGFSQIASFRAIISRLVRDGAGSDCAAGVGVACPSDSDGVDKKKQPANNPMRPPPVLRRMTREGAPLGCHVGFVTSRSVARCLG